jgi:hypothetical protein
MTRIRSLIAKLRSERGDIVMAVGITLLAVVVGTTITVQTVSAAAVMRAAVMESEVRDAVTNVREITLNKLAALQDVAPVSPATSMTTAITKYSTLNAVAYVTSVRKNAADSTVTVRIIGEPQRVTSDTAESKRLVYEETFYEFDTNYFAGTDVVGEEIWASSGDATKYTGYRGGAR